MTNGFWLQTERTIPFFRISARQAVRLGVVFLFLSLVGFSTPGSPLSSITVPAAQAQPVTGFSPQRYKNGTTFGMGIYFAPYRFTVYTEASEQSKPIGTFNWSRKSGATGVTLTTPGGGILTAYPDNLFISYYPTFDVAMIAVSSENGQGWAEIVYDQQRKLTGWVHLAAGGTMDTPPPAASAMPSVPAPKSGRAMPLDVSSGEAGSRQTLTASATSMGLAPGETVPSHFGVFQTWQEFMKLNAKVSGVYWLSGVNDYARSLRSRDEDTAKLIPVTIMRKVKVRFIRGNWLLVEALDFERNTPIGWMRWRDDEGNLMAFPNIVGQRTPILTAF